MSKLRPNPYLGGDLSELRAKLRVYPLWREATETVGHLRSNI